MTLRLGLLLLALMLLWPATANAQSCTLSAQSLAFGTIGTPTAQRDATADVTVTCTGSPGVVRVCLTIDAGTAPSTAINRVMRFGTNQLAYAISATSGGTTWGDTNLTGQEVPVTISGSSGNATARMYGRIAAAQNVVAGTYSSTLAVRGRIPSGGSPCTSGSSGTTLTAASFTANATLGGICSITAAPVNFGTVANLSSGLSASGALSVTCSNTMPYSIALNAGTTTGNTIAARKLALNGAGAGVVSYQLYQDSGRATLWGDGSSGATYPGTGSGTAQTIPVHAYVPNQATPGSGTYRDTVTATITY
ncbi:Csu type fimbrial protein [Lysobacter solisilvae (ex Woo and Kim 2020)]|uniref:Spore coat protein U domain-containing protein n=1 Tax=Agrilutibacter terrestris TaxID=2865112 RepID=A0A7H0FTV2_9GAMM|nr:spore coat protein U domain-containing protein [Lysobacter terrestris]QNP39468.1 spore coat protein U domain-containing protein [Lysobacter terrestris]